VKMRGEVPEGSGADTFVRLRKVAAQRPCEVPEGFGGEDAR